MKNILHTRKIDNETERVLCWWKERNEFVVWTRYKTDPDNFVHGHYFKDLISAVECFDKLDQDQIETRDKKLKALITEQINSAYIKEYRSTRKDPDGLGLLISKYFKWDGLQILKTMYIALEDSNYHTLNRKIWDMIENEENERKNLEMKETIKGGGK